MKGPIMLSTVVYPNVVSVVRLAVPNHCQQPTFDVACFIGDNFPIVKGTSLARLASLLLTMSSNSSSRSSWLSRQWLLNASLVQSSGACHFPPTFFSASSFMWLLFG